MAYAAVTSLMTTLRLLLMQSNSTLNLLQQEQIESLRQKGRSLQSLLESSENVNDCEAVIRVAAQSAEYRIESVMAKIYNVEEQVYEKLSECLIEASKSVDSAREELERNLKNRLQEARVSSLNRIMSDFHFPKGSTQLENDNIVGRESELEDMMSEITRTSSRERQVVVIVGMGGIGKTTFARRVYNDPAIKAHFEIRAWATMSKVYCIREMLTELLSCIKDLSCVGSDNDDDGDLAVKLKRKLQRRRYLVVIDDIWSTNAWDDINQWFPDSKGSQILLTTRCRNVACYAAPGKSPHQMSLLNQTESWKLFQEKIFAKEQQLSSEFLEIGKKIAYNCQGLPLTIVIVAGLLSKSNNALDRWKQIERNVKSAIFEDGYRQCEKVLALSYYYLPQHLKACFLYFGVFPEDTTVPAKELIKLWIAEGFLREEAYKSLEDVGEECLHELIDRNLIFISKHNFTGKAKRCEIHDLIHELCLRKARNDSFLFVVDDNSCVRDRASHVSPGSVQVVPKECQRMVIRSISEIDVINSYCYHDQNEIRSFICSGESRSVSYMGHLDMVFNNFKMIRVLDLCNLSVDTQLIPKLVHLRYLSLTVKYREGLLFSNLPNLQTLIVHDILLYGKSIKRHVIHLDIWSMPLLRNLHSIRSSRISPPSMSNGKTKQAILEHLRTITGVDPAWCKKEIFARMPNVKKLGIQNCRVRDLWEDLPCLSEVKSIGALRISFNDTWLFPLPDRALRCLDQSIFPPALKKLTLINSFLSWEDMDIVGTLPRLEVLKLRRYTCCSNEWEPATGGFSQLKFLLLDRIGFTKWKATDEHFPVLERLYISKCFSLKEIPKEFAYIATLQVIELDCCSVGLETSAKQIPQEQEECLGSTMTAVRVPGTIGFKWHMDTGIIHGDFHGGVEVSSGYSF